MVKTLWASYGDENINFVHVEVYQDFETLEYVPAMAEWGLVTEPWVFIVNKDGIITARYDGPISVQELAPAIESVIREL